MMVDDMLAGKVMDSIKVALSGDPGTGKSINPGRSSQCGDEEYVNARIKFREPLPPFAPVFWRRVPANFMMA